MKPALVYKRLIESLLPERCPRCAGATEGGYCRACESDFPRIDAPCRRCGLPTPVACCPRLRTQWHVRAMVAPFGYARPIPKQIHALKFTGARRLGRALGLALARHAAPGAADVEALLPVPLSRARLRERGYNQAAEIARCLGAELGLPVLEHALRRLKAGPAQSTLGARERHENLRGAYVATRRFDGVRVAVVDDVITTGATVNACARCLLEAGAERVDAWAVARTGE